MRCSTVRLDTLSPILSCFLGFWPSLSSKLVQLATNGAFVVMCIDLQQERAVLFRHCHIQSHQVCEKQLTNGLCWQPLYTDLPHLNNAHYCSSHLMHKNGTLVPCLQQYIGSLVATLPLSLCCYNFSLQKA